VHKASIAVAVARPGWGAAESLGTIGNNPQALAKLVRKLGEAEQLFFCYEAGSCGYGVYRQLTMMGAQCMVVAPSLIPQQAGDRVKTDRRDAQKLARLLRSGELTPVWVPDEQEEALRDLTRARADAVEDVVRKRHQLSKFLLRLGMRPPAGVSTWTIRHRQWLESLKFDQVAQTVVMREYVQALDEARARVERLNRELEEQAQESKQAPLIAALQALRGVSVVTAMTVVAETGDLTRFPSARQVMAYAGVVPREHSSGSSQRRGPITKSGNAHLRHVVVESSWHYRQPPRVGAVLKKRQAGQSEAVKAMAWEAQCRLNRKYRRLTSRGKPSTVAVVAVARELLGFMWAIAQELKSSTGNEQAA